MLMAREEGFIFCDVDGTLVDDFGEVNCRNLDYIRATSKKFVIVTGRTEPQIDEFLSRNELRLDVIGGNGAFIKRIDTPTEMIGEIDKNIVFNICELMGKEDVIYQLHSVSGSYISKGWDCRAWGRRLARVHAESNSVEFQKWVDVYVETFLKDAVGHYDGLSEVVTLNPIIKIEAFSEKESVLERLKERLTDIKGVRVEKSYCTSIEVLNKSVSKGSAIKKYMEEYAGEVRGISIGIGDNLNDISMFKVVDYSFAVQNCCDELKKYAKVIQCSNKEPFLYEIEHYMEEK